MDAAAAASAANSADARAARSAARSSLPEVSEADDDVAASAIPGSAATPPGAASRDPTAADDARSTPVGDTPDSGAVYGVSTVAESLTAGPSVATAAPDCPVRSALFDDAFGSSDASAAADDLEAAIPSARSAAPTEESMSSAAAAASTAKRAAVTAVRSAAPTDSSRSAGGVCAAGKTRREPPPGYLPRGASRTRFNHEIGEPAFSDLDALSDFDALSFDDDTPPAASDALAEADLDERDLRVFEEVDEPVADDLDSANADDLAFAAAAASALRTRAAASFASAAWAAAAFAAASLVAAAAAAAVSAFFFSAAAAFAAAAVAAFITTASGIGLEPRTDCTNDGPDVLLAVEAEGALDCAAKLGTTGVPEAAEGPVAAGESAVDAS